MTISVSDFRVRFPEFSDNTEYPDERVQLFIDDSALLYMGTDENRWCGKYDIAQAYLTAHLLVVGTQTEAGDTSSTGGVVTSKSAGGVSVSRSTTSKDRSEADDFYMTTSYGQQFIVIRNSCFVGVAIANCL